MRLTKAGKCGQSSDMEQYDSGGESKCNTCLHRAIATCNATSLKASLQHVVQVQASTGNGCHVRRHRAQHAPVNFNCKAKHSMMKSQGALHYSRDTRHHERLAILRLKESDRCTSGHAPESRLRLRPTPLDYPPPLEIPARTLQEATP